VKRSPLRETLSLSFVKVLNATKSKRGVIPLISPVLGILEMERPNPIGFSSKLVFL